MPDLQQYTLQIIAEKEQIVVPENISVLADDLIDAYKSGRAIENILLPVFNALEAEELELTVDTFNEGADNILEIFKTRVLEILENEKQDFDVRQADANYINRNLFEVANTPNLYLSNKYSRVISENLGHKFEDIASLSPRVINPEVHFGFKIKGIDVIIYKDSNFYFCQLKTKKDTLTGSQRGRSEIELSIHPRSFFVACLSLGNFTFNTNKPNINRIHGTQFWSEIGVNYNVLVAKLSESLQEIEDNLFNED